MGAAAGPEIAALSLEDLRAIAVPATYVVAIGSMLVELLLLRVGRVTVDHAGGRTSLVSGALAFGGLALAHRLAYAAVLEGAWAHRLFDAGGAAWVWIAAILAYDLCFYVAHRLGHEVRLLWCFHAVHHSSTEMRLVAAVRGSALDFVYLPWFHAWLPLVGIPPAMLASIESVSRIWGVLTHVSPALVGRLGVLEHVLVTPSVHRVHHGTEEAYLDRNYSELLTIWDRLFGTYQPEHAPPTYGLVTPFADDRLATVQLAPWRALARDLRHAPDMRARIRYLFDAPGWRHDGVDGRVRARRARTTGAEARAASR